MDDLAYFQEAARVFELAPTPDIITKNIGSAVSIEDLTKAYNNRTIFRCDERGGKYYLSAVQTCWSKDNYGKAGNQVACPTWMPSASCKGEVFLSAPNVCFGRATSNDKDKDRSQKPPKCIPGVEGDKFCQSQQPQYERCAKSKRCTNVPNPNPEL